MAGPDGTRLDWGATAGISRLPGGRLGLSTAGQAGLVAAAFSTEGAGWAVAGFGGHDRLAAGGSTGRSARRLGWRARGHSRHEVSRGFRGVWLPLRASPVSRRASKSVRGISALAPRSVRSMRRYGAGQIGDISPLTTSAFALHATRSWADAGTLTLSLSQPLRVETGHARLSVPVGRTKDGYVRRSSVTADLVPTGRQIEVAAQWQQRLETGGELSLGAVWTPSSGARRRGGPRSHAAGRWRQTF